MHNLCRQQNSIPLSRPGTGVFLLNTASLEAPGEDPAEGASLQLKTNSSAGSINTTVQHAGPQLKHSSSSSSCTSWCTSTPATSPTATAAAATAHAGRSRSFTGRSSSPSALRGRSRGHHRSASSPRQAARSPPNHRVTVRCISPFTSLHAQGLARYSSSSRSPTRQQGADEGECITASSWLDPQQHQQLMSSQAAWAGQDYVETLHLSTPNSYSASSSSNQALSAASQQQLGQQCPSTPAALGASISHSLHNEGVWYGKQPLDAARLPQQSAFAAASHVQQVAAAAAARPSLDLSSAASFPAGDCQFSFAVSGSNFAVASEHSFHPTAWNPGNSPGSPNIDVSAAGSPYIGSPAAGSPYAGRPVAAAAGGAVGSPHMLLSPQPPLGLLADDIGGVCFNQEGVAMADMLDQQQLQQQLLLLQLNSSGTCRPLALDSVQPQEQHMMQSSYSSPLPWADEAGQLQQQELMGSASISSPLTRVHQQLQQLDLQNVELSDEQHQLAVRMTDMALDQLLLKKLQLAATRERSTAAGSAEQGAHMQLSHAVAPLMQGPAAAISSRAALAARSALSVVDNSLLNQSVLAPSAWPGRPGPVGPQAQPDSQAQPGDMSAYMAGHQQQLLGHRQCMSAAYSGPLDAADMSDAARQKLLELRAVQQMQMELQDDLLISLAQCRNGP